MTLRDLSRSGRRYNVISDGEPVRFENLAEAAEFLVGILRLAAAPALSFPAAPEAHTSPGRYSPPR